MKNISSLIRKEEGVVGIAFSIFLAFLLIGLLALAVDGSRMYNIYTRSQAALDASLLGAIASHSTSLSDIQTETGNLLQANFPTGTDSSHYDNLTVTTDNPSKPSVYKACMNVDIPFFFAAKNVVKDAATNQVKTNTDISFNMCSQVSVANTYSPLMFSIILDSGYDMSQPINSGGTPRLTMAKSSLTTALNALFPGGVDTISGTYVSIIPFSDAVRVNPMIGNPLLQPALQYSNYTNFNGCMGQRMGTVSSIDAKPGSTANSYFNIFAGPFDTPANISVVGMTYDYATGKQITQSFANADPAVDNTGYNIARNRKVDTSDNKLKDFYDITFNAYMAGHHVTTDPYWHAALANGTGTYYGNVVAGGRFSPELDYLQDFGPTHVNASETLSIDFGTAYKLGGATTSVYSMVATENEVGRWQTYNIDSSGNSTFLSTGIFRGPPSSSAQQILAFSAPTPFRKIVFSAVNCHDTTQTGGTNCSTDGLINIDLNSSLPQVWDNSDYGIQAMEYLPDCNHNAAQFFMNSHTVINNELSAISSDSADGPSRAERGIDWGFFSLSPNWQGLLSTDSTTTSLPGAYGSAPNVALFIVQGSSQTSQTDLNNAAATCTAMKNNNILIYTISFNAPANVVSMLQSCATSSAYYYNAPDGTTLASALTDIVNQVNKLRLHLSQ